jgi:hypothetical protein
MARFILHVTWTNVWDALHVPMGNQTMLRSHLVLNVHLLVAVLSVKQLVFQPQTQTRNRIKAPPVTGRGGLQG